MDNIIFNQWNELKKAIHVSNKLVCFNEADVWWCSLGKNINTESYGKGESFRRPVLVIKKLSSDSCIAIPLITKSKQGTWFVEFDLHGIKRTALLNQIKMIDIRRFQRRIGQLDSFEFDEIKKRLKLLLNL